LYERRAQLESRAPLTLVTTLEVEEIPTVELVMNYDDSTIKKVKVPTHDLESLEQVLYCYYEFLEAARKLRLEGDEWFEFYRDTLRGHARTAWDVITDGVPARDDRNERTFKVAFRLFVTTIVDETAHRSLLEYLRTTVKPRNMSVLEVARRLQVLCMYSVNLPTEDGEFPVPMRTEEIKTLFYNMMPEDWKNTFTKGNLRMSSMNISQMAIYFNGLGSLEAPKNSAGKKRRNNDNHSNHNSRNNRRRNDYGRQRGNERNGYSEDRGGRHNRGGRSGIGRGRGGRGRGRGNGRGNYSNNRVLNDDTCPVHGGHKWRECFLNPHGDDYRPRTGRQSNNNSQGRGNGSRRGDAYHNDRNGGSRGNGSNNSNNHSNRNENNQSGGDRRDENGNSNNRNNNDHYLADIGSPEWN